MYYEYLARLHWGPVFWSCIHVTALGYPREPNETDKEAYRLFFKQIGAVMPCLHCRTHYTELLETYPLESYMESQGKLFEWTVCIHNAINKKRGQEFWTIEEALKQWANRYEREG